MIKVIRLINEINNSNCYIVQDQLNGKCFIVDPGSRNIDNILEFMGKAKTDLDYIILTHSHFDHISGVGPLAKRLNAKIVSSRLCSEKIQDPVKNLSYFADLEPIVAPHADICIEDLEDHFIRWNDNFISFYHSPGHSKCSISVQLEKILFTGDTLLKGIKSKVTQPDGNREELRQSIFHIYETMPGDITVFPGHGESFVLETQESTVALKK